MSEHAIQVRLRKVWQSRAPRERTIIAALAALVGAALYLALVLSAERARAPLRASVATLRAQATRLEQHAIEYGHLRAAPAAAASATGLHALVQAQVGAAGLSRQLVRIDAIDPDQVMVVFGAVAFADWLNWLASLKSQQVRLDACRVEALSTPGLVSVTATLVRPKPQ